MDVGFIIKQKVNITYIPFHVEYVSYILFFAETLIVYIPKSQVRRKIFPSMYIDYNVLIF